MNVFSTKIDWLRSASGLCQVDIEEACGLAENRLSKWGAGHGEPTAAQCLAIARLFGVDPEWLADDAAPIQHPVPALTAAEREVLGIVRQMGVDEARKRLGGAAIDPPKVVKAVVRRRRPRGQS